MPTKNRRVAAYLPPHIDERLESFKVEQGIEGDSQALLHILGEYFGVSYQVAHKVDESISQRIEVLEGVIDSLRSESRSELLSELQQQVGHLMQLVAHLQSRLDNLSEPTPPASQDRTLATGELAKRLGIDSTTLTHMKKKAPEEISKRTQAKDPDGIGWEYIKSVNRFRPIGDLPSELQGRLFN